MDIWSDCCVQCSQFEGDQIMACKFTYSATDGSINTGYNVTAAVGPGAANRRDDVLLVQYFLGSIYANSTLFQPPRQPPDGDWIKVDGSAGTQTFQWIKYFQTETKRIGFTIWPDGRIDACPKPNAQTPIHHARYTISIMNGAFATARPDVDMTELENAIDIPQELASAIAGLLFDFTDQASGRHSFRRAGARCVPAM
jgi:hypothetical protein